MYKRCIPLAVIACLLAPVLTVPAGASSESLYDEYLNFGVIAGCAHSEAELQSALTTVPADIQAYDPGFTQALNAALDRRASGCSAGVPVNKNPAAAGGVDLATDGSPGPVVNSGVPLPPLPQASDPSDFPILAINLVIVLAAVLAAAVALLPGRRAGSEPN